METIDKKIVDNDITKYFTLQWHVTRACNKKCTICYFTDEERERSSEVDLSLQQGIEVIKDFKNFTTKHNFTPGITFTGGNPLLRPDFFDLLSYAKDNGITSQILGNPTPLNDRMVKRLIDHGVTRYQISFDGMEDMHDAIRGKGSFKQATRSLDILANGGMETVVMSTVTKANQKDVLQLPKYVLDHGVRKFDFARLVPTGNGANLKNLVFSPQEYKQFLENMYDTYQGLIDEGYDQMAMGTKDHLWKLLLYEKGEFEVDKNIEFVVDGCSIGSGGFCMDSDGELYGCKRMNVPSGNITEISVEEFVFNNPQMEEYRNIESLEACTDCELLNYCRGCPAVANAMTGDWKSKDPQCWKE